jgi:hypothetical protein
MSDCNWKAIARSANWIWNEMERPDADFRDVRSELSVILQHLVGSRPDDLPARAVMLLADAWLTAARDDGFRFDFGDDEDGVVSAK